MTDEEQDKNLLRSLLISIVSGCFVFVFLLLLVQLDLAYFAAGTRLDSSFADFYPMMVGLGVLWGFSRWCSYEQGEYNPFHSD